MSTEEYLSQDKFKEIDKMTKDELREEVRIWRNLWSWLDEDTKYYLTKIGKMCRIVTRAYQGYLGRFLQPHFGIKEFELECVKVEYDQNDGKYYEEYKVIRIPVSSLTHFEFIEDRQEVSREELFGAQTGASEELEIENL
jgi:hypothetical protein